MYVARSRLFALKIWKLSQASLKSSCFKKWKIFTKHSLLKHEYVMKAVNNHEFVLKQRGLQAWVAFVDSKHACQIAYTHLSQLQCGFVREDLLHGMTIPNGILCIGGIF
eukprot:c19598_g1_i2 orf=54-380(-)